MNKEVCKEHIDRIRNTEKPIGRIDIPWKDKLEPMNVYQIPLEYLIYNKYNGRILSRTKSLENQNKTITAETEEGKKLIEKLLWESKPKKNEDTLKSLKKIGQEKVGIITEDGYIIDGNRRAMLLNKIEHIDYFKAVILPVEYEGNPIEIEKFETKYQLGEERKLDYNPIEIYLKIQQLYMRLAGKRYDSNDIDSSSIKKIYEWIGNYKNISNENDIIFSLEVMSTMDDYLDRFSYNGFYTALDKREEQFRRLTDWLTNLYGESSRKGFYGYTNDEVDDLKFICYELIRIKYKNEKFRYLAQGQKQNQFFGNESIWKSFKEKHFELTTDFQEPELNLDTDNLEKTIDGIDGNFDTFLGEKINENVDSHYQKLRNKQAQDEPEKLINKALDSFNSINKNYKTFGSPKVQKLVQELGDQVLNTLQDNSPIKILDHIINLFENIKLDKIAKEDLEQVKKQTKRIQQIGYKINKTI